VHIPTDGRVLYHECRSLCERYDVTLACFDDHPPHTVSGVRIESVMPRPSGRRERWSRRAEVVDVARRLEADLYHFHDPELIRPMKRLGAETGRPIVYDVHEHYPDAVTQRAWIPHALRGVTSRAADRYELRAAAAFDALVVADDALHERFSSTHPRVVTLRNYPPLDLFPPPSDAPETHRSSRPTLVYSGSISQVRGLATMLDTARIVRDVFPDLRLVLVGTPTEDARVPLAAALHEMPECVEHLGPVPYEHLADVLRDADVGLSLLDPHPKYEKDVPTKVFDYMAGCLPYVASDMLPLREATGGVGGILVPPGDVAAAAEAVLTILQDEDRASRLARDGRGLVEERLNWSEQTRDLFGLYEGLL
jgi:glycosyltransferase involved in cell wall biosynthesis